MERFLYKSDSNELNRFDQKKKEKEKEFETHWVHENLEETTSWIAK